MKLNFKSLNPVSKSHKHQDCFGGKKKIFKTSFATVMEHLWANWNVSDSVPNAFVSAKLEFCAHYIN